MSQKKAKLFRKNIKKRLTDELDPGFVKDMILDLLNSGEKCHTIKALLRYQREKDEQEKNQSVT